MKRLFLALLLAVMVFAMMPVTNARAAVNPRGTVVHPTDIDLPPAPIPPPPPK